MCDGSDTNPADPSLGHIQHLGYQSTHFRRSGVWSGTVLCGFTDSKGAFQSDLVFTFRYIRCSPPFQKAERHESQTPKQETSCYGRGGPAVCFQIKSSGPQTNQEHGAKQHELSITRDTTFAKFCGCCRQDVINV